MTRGYLSDDELHAINEKLIDVRPLQERTLALSPDLISSVYPHQSEVPLAAVCFRDLAEVLCECRIALHEYYAHGIWYRQHKTPAAEAPAAMMELFFLSDLALRLYTAGEHLANAVFYMLEIDESNLKPYKCHYTSRQTIVGRYLFEKRKGSVIAQELEKLANSKNWKRAIHYRNNWVHEQPPLVEGRGIRYKRESRWRQDSSTGNMILEYGGGDEPEFSIEQIKDNLEKGLSKLVYASSKCLYYFECELQKKSG